MSTWKDNKIQEHLVWILFDIFTPCPASCMLYLGPQSSCRHAIHISCLNMALLSFPTKMSSACHDSLCWLSSSFLQELLERVVTKTDRFEVYKLEKLYALLCQSIYRHRRDFNKTALIQVGTGLMNWWRFFYCRYLELLQEEKHRYKPIIWSLALRKSSLWEQ